MGSVARGKTLSILRRRNIGTGFRHSVPAAGIHGPAMPPDEEIYDNVAQYPEIEPYRNIDEKSEAETVKKIKDLGTVEEKQYFVNLPKMFGWTTFHINSSRLPPTALKSAQYYTNTTLESVQKLPGRLDEEYSKKTAEEILPFLKEIVNFHLGELEQPTDFVHDQIKYREIYPGLSEEKGLFVSQSALVNGISRLLMAKLMGGHAHLREAALDHNPRNEAFWFRGHIDNELAHVERRLKAVDSDFNKAKERPHTKEDAHRQADRTFQFLGDDTILQLRTPKMISPLVSLTDDLVVSGSVPLCDHNPKHIWSKKRRFGTNLLATWTGTATPFNHLSVVSNINKLFQKETARKSDFGFIEYDDMITTKCLMNGFGTAYAAACNQGFTPFTDPATPFVSQVAVTDGKKWKLSCYQLNKMALQGISESNEEMKRNICWHANEEELFSEVDGKVSDINVDLLSNIISMYVREPTVGEKEIPNEGHLHAEKRHLHQIKNTFNREEFHRNHRNMYSNRPYTHNLENYPEVLAHQRLWQMEAPEVMHPFGLRDRPWFHMAKYAPEGREFWHPEFRWYDNKPGRRLQAKFRGPRGKWRTPAYLPTITAPLPPDDE